MWKSLVAVGLPLLLCALIQPGCSSSNRDTGQQPPAVNTPAHLPLPALPAPSQLRQAAVITSGVFRYGREYVDTLPYQRAAIAGDRVRFTPDADVHGLAGAAFAIYAFDSTGYSTDDMVHLAWNTRGTEVGDQWLGLANFTRDRWDWISGSLAGAHAYDPAHYVSNNCLYAVVACAGDDTWVLDSIRISADVPPRVVAITPYNCREGQPVTYSAEVAGTVDSYAWDFGGGATPNTSSAAAPLITPGAKENYAASLTISNAFGSDRYSFTLRVLASDSDPEARFDVSPDRGDPPLLVAFDASDSFDPDDGTTPGAGIVLYEFDFTDDGSYDYSSATVPTTSYTYTLASSFTCRLRVTDNESNTATSTRTIRTDLPPGYTVSGSVAMQDAGGLSNVRMELMPGHRSDYSDEAGAYAITEVVDGSYTLTPSRSGWTFDPASLPVTVAGGDIGGFNFAGSCGPLADLAGDPLLGNAPLSVNFDASASTDPDNGGTASAGITRYEWDWDNDGTFDYDSAADATVAHTYGVQGSYTCLVRVTDDEGQTASATLEVIAGLAGGYIASGHVYFNGTGLPGVSLSFSGGLAAVSTDADGFWYRDGIANGTYTVTPSHQFFSFTPGSRQFNISGDGAAVDDFVASLQLDLEDDTLYALPLATVATVGQPVRILVATGQPPNELQVLSSAGFTVETAGTYVSNSFNIGEPGGARTATDGYWALMTPPPPNGAYMDLGDALNPGQPTGIGGGLHRYNFAIVPMGSFTAPPSIGSGAVLFNFCLSFSTPGVYHLGFQESDGSFDQTYYSGLMGINYFWGVLDGSYTITVN